MGMPLRSVKKKKKNYCGEAERGERKRREEREREGRRKICKKIQEVRNVTFIMHRSIMRDQVLLIKTKWQNVRESQKEREGAQGVGWSGTETEMET